MHTLVYPERETVHEWHFYANAFLTHAATHHNDYHADRLCVRAIVSAAGSVLASCSKRV
jgi:hypothetical protein